MRGTGKVGQIRLLRVRVPFAGEHAAAAVRLEPHANAADASKQIDEGKRRVALVDGIKRQQALANGIDQIRRRLGLAQLPAADGALAKNQLPGQFFLRVAAMQSGEQVSSRFNSILARDRLRSYCPLFVPFASYYIGRESCLERGCYNVKIWVCAGTLQKNKKH